MRILLPLPQRQLHALGPLIRARRTDPHKCHALQRESDSSAVAVDEPRALEPVADEREARRPGAMVPPEQEGREEDVVVRVEGPLFEEDAGVERGRGEEEEVRVGEGEVVVAAGFGEEGFFAGWGAGGGGEGGEGVSWGCGEGEGMGWDGGWEVNSP
jgi:hypothetical protein